MRSLVENLHSPHDEKVLQLLAICDAGTVDEILAKGIREKGVATIFGDGRNVANYIAVDDVAEFAVRILSRPEVMTEAVEAGGPSNLSQNDLATLIERRLKSSGKRRHVPVVAMRAANAAR